MIPGCGRHELVDEDATREFATSLAAALKGGESVGLSGDLGAGKTTFVRALVEALGYGSTVSSPTYVLHHEYALPSGLVVDHWDLYRVSDLPDELQTRCPRDHIRIVEWPEKTPELLSALSFRLTFEYGDPGDPCRRTVSFEKGAVSSV